MCKNAEENLDIFLHQLMNQKVIGIGEIGLDYHWNSVGNLKGRDAREIQKKWFKYQLELATKKDLPVSIHIRDAIDDALESFNHFSLIHGVIHCFSYGEKELEKILEKGLYIGVGGTLTYKNNKELQEAVKKCPMNRILLETDAPYLSPQPVKKQVNDSKNIEYVIEKICELKEISREEVIEKTEENVKRLFGI